MAMDAWVSIPFIMILLLAGLQALPGEVLEAAKVDGATGWQSFWKITFPLMLPVSLTAVVLRIIFELKLADIVINVTAGGPGGATDTVSSFIYREYRDRSNVGYGTMLAEFYLVIIIIFVTPAAQLGQPLDAAGHMSGGAPVAGHAPAAATPTSDTARRARYVSRPGADLWRADLLGVHLALSRSIGRSPPPSRSPSTSPRVT